MKPIISTALSRMIGPSSHLADRGAVSGIRDVLSSRGHDLARRGHTLLASTVARGLTRVANRFHLDAKALGLEAPQGYQPIADNVMWIAGDDGVMRPSHQGRYADREALAQANPISLQRAMEIAEQKFGLIFVGRSGFVDETHSRMFKETLKECLIKTTFLLQRAGFDIDALLPMTSFTGGTVDAGVRQAAAYLGLSALAFICEDLKRYIDPRDSFVSLTVNTDGAGGNQSYSEVSIGLSKLQVSLPGGEFALFNDLVEALKLDKPIALFKMDAIPALNPIKGSKKVVIGNHVLVLLDEKKKLAEAVVEKLKQQKIRGAKQLDIWHPSQKHREKINQLLKELLKTPQFSKSAHARLLAKLDGTRFFDDPIALWEQMSVVASAKDLATVILKMNGFEFGDLDDYILSKHNAAVEGESTPLMQTRVNVALTGRSQMINKVSGFAEMDMADGFLEELKTILLQRGYRARDIGIIHGHGNTGLDGTTLRHFTESGFSSLGIVKPEWAEWTDPDAKRRSDYILTEDTKEAFAQGYTQYADMLMVFEGNDGVVAQILAALKKGISVVSVPLTGDPMISDFWDVQKDKLFKNRVSNVGKWLHEARNPRARKNLLQQILSRLEGGIDAAFYDSEPQTQKKYLEELKGKISGDQGAQAPIEFALNTILLCELIDRKPELVHFVRTPAEMADLMQAVDEAKNQSPLIPVSIGK